MAQSTQFVHPEVAAPEPEPTEADEDDGVVETTEPLEEDTFEMEPPEPEEEDPAEGAADRDALSEAELADFPDVSFAVAESPVPGVPFPADYESMGRTQDPLVSDFGFDVCTYRQEFESEESMEDLAAWFTDLMPHNGYEVDTDRDEVVGTDWGDPDSPEFPGRYSLATLSPEGETATISFETTVLDVEDEGYRSVYVQMQTPGDCT